MSRFGAIESSLLCAAPKLALVLEGSVLFWQFWTSSGWEGNPEETPESRDLHSGSVTMGLKDRPW